MLTNVTRKGKGSFKAEDGSKTEFSYSYVLPQFPEKGREVCEVLAQGSQTATITLHDGTVVEVNQGGLLTAMNLAKDSWIIQKDTEARNAESQRLQNKSQTPKAAVSF